MLNPLKADEKAQLFKICVNCGEYYGRHKYDSNNCPIVNNHNQTTDYHPFKFFYEWKDIDNKSSTEGD